MYIFICPTCLITIINRCFLLGHYYVPLLRSEDNSTQPLIGETWSPDLPVRQSGTVSSPVDPLLSVKAYVGPMSPSQVSSVFH